MIAAGPSVIIVLVKGDVSGVRAGVKLRLSRMITSSHEGAWVNRNPVAAHFAITA
jgi:hypothetical protein